MENDEKKVILSNSATDMTGSSVSLENNLGQVSGDDALIEVMTKDTSDWESNLYLELTTTDKSGIDNVYQLHQMPLTFRLGTKYNDDTKFMTWDFQGVDMLLLTTQLCRTVAWFCSAILGGQYESKSKLKNHYERTDLVQYATNPEWHITATLQLGRCVHRWKF